MTHGIESYFFSRDENPIGPNSKKLFSPLPHSLKQRLSYRWRRLFIYDKLAAKKNELSSRFSGISDTISCEFAGLPFGHSNLRLIPEIRKADAVILHWVNETIDISRFFYDFKSVPVIWTLHDMNPFLGIFHYTGDQEKNKKSADEVNRNVRGIKYLAYKQKAKKVAIVAPSQWLLQEAKKSGAFPAGNFTCIPYSLNLEVFRPKNRDEIRSAMGISAGQRVILFISDNVFNKRKGFDLLLNAVTNAKGKNYTLLALGEQKATFNSEIPVKFAGKITDDHLLADYYNAADVFLLPSREDNLPNVMLEAFSCGCPVIGFPIGGVKEHVIEGRTGVLAAEVSGKALANAIDDFFASQQSYSRSNIRNYAEEMFAQAQQVGKYVQLISEMKGKK